MSNSRQIASLPNILTLIDDAGGQFIKQQAAGVTTSYTITWPSAVGSSGAVLALTDGSGGLGWQSTLGIALSGGTVNNSVIGGSTPAAITGTTITANTAFVGPLTGNATTATALATGRTFSFTGDATGTSGSFTGAANATTSLTLANTGVSANSYGSTTAIPVITIDSKGRITAATTASISSSLTIAADSGSNDTVGIGSDTLTFAGTSNEVETTVSNNQIQIGLPSTVSGLTTVNATNLQGALAGTIASTTTAVTQAASDNTTKVATTAYVNTAVANLVDSAPGALNTLNELAAALGDDASFSTTVTNSIATKLALAGGTMTGNLILGDNVKALFGTGSDLEIYHDGSNSYIVDSGTGGILYRGGTQTFQNAAGSKTMAVLNGATSVDLYYDNSKKFETTAAGVTITGTGTATTFSATTLTGTLSTAAQPNVTSVGTLSALTVSGALNATLTTAAQTNITSVGTLTGLTVNGTANATTFVGALTGNVTGNVSGTAATVTGAAQTNITSVGTLSALTVSGDVTIDTSTLKVDSSNNRVGILNASPDVTLDIGSATDSIHIPVGTTAQRPGSPAAGYFRYNSSLSQFEGYTSAWGAIGGGGTNTFNHNVFTGNGSTTAFALAAATESENNLLVFIDGVFQEQGAYSIATSGGTTTLTMSAAPASGRKLVVYQVSAGVSGNNLNIDTMTGDGSDTTLTLSIAPVNENNTQVFFDGVYQNKSTYSISGTTLTFSTAPPTGVAVEVMTFTQTEVNVPVNDTIDTVHIKDNAVTAGKIEASLDLSSKSLTLPAVAVPSASTATTQAASDNTTKLATTAYVTTAIAALIDGAPGTLNTLNELAAALADDAAFSSTLTTSLAAKANLAAPNFTGNVTFDSTTLTVDATNNRVGIGTASPATPLDIMTTGANQLYIRNTGSSAQNNAIVSLRTGGYSNIALDGATVDLKIGGSSKLHVDASGNVGIGSTTISSYNTNFNDLVVDGGANSGVTVVSGTSGDGTLAFADGTTGNEAYRGYIQYTHAGDTLKFGAGGALAATIDASGNVGIGTASPTGLLHLSSASPALYITDTTNNADGVISVDNNGSLVFNADLNSEAANTNVRFLLDGSERMRIDSSGNVGIGTDSPVAWSSVQPSLTLSGNNSSFGDRTGALALKSQNGTYQWVFDSQTSGTLTISNSSNSGSSWSYPVNIDTSGNVGIGTSNPQAAKFSTTASGILEVAGTKPVLNIHETDVTDAELFMGMSGGTALLGTTGDGILRFLTGTSSASEAMRIDSSGNVGIQNSNPPEMLTIGSTSDTNVRIQFLSSTTGGNTIHFGDGTSADAYRGWINYTHSDDALAFATAGAERMRIDSSGDVGIGTASPTEKLDINGGGLIVRGALTNGVGSGNGLRFEHTSDIGQIYSLEPNVAWRELRLNASQQTFYIAGGEAMRIDSNGRLCVNTQSSIGAGRISIAAALYSTDVGIVIKNTAAVYGSSTGYISFLNSGGAVAGVITHTAGTTVNYGTSSDERLKTNIQDANDAGSLIDSMQVRQFDWKEDGIHQDYGMIAQELHEIAPLAAPAVQNSEDMMSVDYSKLVPMLVKEIQMLRSRVAALEES